MLEPNFSLVCARMSPEQAIDGEAFLGARVSSAGIAHLLVWVGFGADNLKSVQGVLIHKHRVGKVERSDRCDLVRGCDSWVLGQVLRGYPALKLAYYGAGTPDLRSCQSSKCRSTVNNNRLTDK